MVKKIFSIVIVLSLLSACNSNHRVKVSKKEYLTNHKSVLLTDLHLPKGLRNKLEAKEYIEENVKTLFKEHGVVIHGPSVFNKEYEIQKRAVGGVYDPDTGEYDRKRSQLAEDRTLKVLQKKYGISSVLFYNVRVKGAKIDNFRAEWDGRSEVYEANNSDLTNFLSSLVSTTHGTIGALSLTVFLHDMNDNEMYYGAGGLQLVSKIDDDDKFIPVPADALLTDERLLKFSINEAFRKLFGLKRIRNREINKI